MAGSSANFWVAVAKSRAAKGPLSHAWSAKAEGPAAPGEYLDSVLRCGHVGCFRNPDQELNQYHDNESTTHTASPFDWTRSGMHPSVL